MKKIKYDIINEYNNAKSLSFSNIQKQFNEKLFKVILSEEKAKYTKV